MKNEMDIVLRMLTHSFKLLHDLLGRERVNYIFVSRHVEMI
jgi:hypothetical protein